MKISVIIPTLNAVNFLPELLVKLNNQSVRPLEILVIDSQSEDATRELAQAGGATIIDQPRTTFNHGGTRNAAAEVAAGDYLVFMTQDALPADEHLLENLIGALDQDEKIAVAYARQVAYAHARPIEKFVRSFNYPETPRTKTADDLDQLGVKTFFCSNTCAAYKRELFFKQDRFRSDTIMNEDMAYAFTSIMNGYKVSYAAAAVVYHSHDYSALQQFRRNVDIGVFFSNNPQLAVCARNESEGLRYLKEAVAYLLGEGAYLDIIRLFVDAAARFSGYRIGRHYRLLPLSFMRRLSMNRGYWGA